MRVGFIGLGRMGMPVAQNLLKAGFQLTVHNRSRGKVNEIAKLGATPATSPAEVTQASDIVLACLPDVPTVEQVFLGEMGVVPNARPGQVLVDHSTTGPSTAKKIAQAAETKGAFFLDAPVGGSGGPVGAAAMDATLRIMVGGDLSAYETALPVFQAMGKDIRHLGPSGSGSAIKLVHNLVGAINCLGVAEGYLLGMRLGIDPQLLLERLSIGAARSAVLSYMSPKLLGRDFRGDRVPLRLLAKDVELAEEIAGEAGSPLPLGSVTNRVFRDAASKGLEENDISAVLLVLEELANKQSSE